MKVIQEYILEKLKLNKDTKIYKYYPNDAIELRKLLKQLLNERGKNADLNDIDVSGISKLSPIKGHGTYIGLFESLDPHNIDISKWDVSNAKGFGAMFSGCNNFNCNLSNWNLENAKYINTMFYNCVKFTGEGLDNWKLNKSVQKNDVFHNCFSLKKIPNWYHG